MKKTFLAFSCFITTQLLFGQNPKYLELVKKADLLYNAKEYKFSAFTFSEAFRINGWKATSIDRYNAACAWALANSPDSSFFQLDRIATKAN